MAKKYSKSELVKLLTLDQFPRSASYDPEWVIENLMGSNVLWLTEYVVGCFKLL